MHVLLVNGPNLNLLGTRSPDVYGELTLSELEDRCRAWSEELGIHLETFQSNHEGELIDRLHAASTLADGIVINPGALAHYSYALHDAIEAIPAPVVEVHISDIGAREPWRRVSVVAAACLATITGKGIEGYREALTLLATTRGTDRGPRTADRGPRTEG